MKNLLAEILIILIGKYANYKNNFCLSRLDQRVANCMDNNPYIDEFVKFAHWKLEDYKLSDTDKRIIEYILPYESEYQIIIV